MLLRVWTIFIVASLARSAAATFAIVAADAQSRQVGAAVASCTGNDYILSNLYASVPGHGAAISLGHVNFMALGRFAHNFRRGLSVADSLREVASYDFDPNYCGDLSKVSRDHENPSNILFCGRASRQYGVVDLKEGASFTGEVTLLEGGHLTGAVDGFVYSIQGTMLTSKKVLEQMEAAFRSTAGDLVERLLAAIVAAGEHGQGDRRCVEHGISADAVMLRVDNPTGPGLDRGERPAFNISTIKAAYQLYHGPLLREQVNGTQPYALFDVVGCDDHAHNPIPQLERLVWQFKRGGTHQVLEHVCIQEPHPLFDNMPADFELFLSAVATVLLGLFTALFFLCRALCCRVEHRPRNNPRSRRPRSPPVY